MKVYRAPDQHGVTPQHKGRFPGFDVLDEVSRWDVVTAGVVLARLAPITDLSFFTEDEDAIAGPLCDRLLAQDSEPKVPVVALIDTRLANGETDGWHYDSMPEDGEAWRRSLHELNEASREEYGLAFTEIDATHQEALIQQVQDAAQDEGKWRGFPAKYLWSLWTRYVTTAFYSHPWAWNEIGFPGPAYPRGYKNLGLDSREPFEVPEQPARPERAEQ